MAGPAFVQAATTGWSTVVASQLAVTLGAPTLAGDLVVINLTGRGATAATPPAGFALVAGPTSPATGTGAMQSYSWFKTSPGGETVFTVTGLAGDLASIHALTWRLGGVNAWAILGSVPAPIVADNNAGPVAPTIAPPAAKNAVLMEYEANNPNYGPALTGGWTVRATDNGGATPRTFNQTFEQTTDSTTGTYGGTYSGAGGETSWTLIAAGFTPAATGNAFTGAPGGSVW